MASIERRGKRALAMHHQKVRELVKECLAKMNGINNNDVKMYHYYRNKWKFHCRLVNSDSNQTVELKESAFDTYMDQIAHELKMKKKANRVADRKDRPGIFNVFFGAIVNLFKK